MPDGGLAGSCSNASHAGGWLADFNLICEYSPGAEITPPVDLRAVIMVRALAGGVRSHSIGLYMVK